MAVVWAIGLLSSLAHGNSGREEWADEGLMRRKQGECLQRLEGKLRVLQGPVTSIICTYHYKQLMFSHMAHL